MKEIINKFVKAYDYGFLPIDMPVGLGKTTQALQYTYEVIIEAANEGRLDDIKPIFFVTTLKKNLPISQLYQLFATNNQLELLNHVFLMLGPTCEQVFFNITRDDLNIPEEIKATEEYKKLYQTVEIANNTHDKDFRNYQYDEVRHSLEPKFRRMVEGKIKNLGTIKERKMIINNDTSWEWLKTLYPQINLPEKKIIFLSMDRALLPIDTLYSQPINLFNDNIVDGSTFFIDEFDATKTTVLNYIINSRANNTVDIISMFLAIHSSLETHKFTRTIGHNNNIDRSFNELRESAEQLYEKYNLKYSFKTNDEDIKSNSRFMFQSHQYQTITDNSHSRIVYRTNEKANRNIIDFVNSVSDDETRLQLLIYDLRHFLLYFRSFIGYYARCYMSVRNAGLKNSEKDLISINEAVSTILYEFNFSQDMINFMVEQVINYQSKANVDVNGFYRDNSFYSQGFVYSCIKDDMRHDMQSKISMVNYNLTPEAKLLSLCLKAKVIGLSATASIETVLGNYDLPYIKSMLGDHYVTINESDRQRIKEEFDRLTEGYVNVDIKTKLIGCSDYNAESWVELLRSKEAGLYLNDIMEQSCGTNLYNKQRYLRLAKVLYDYIADDNIRSGLALLTRLPNRGNDLNLQILKSIAECIASQLNKPFDAENNMLVISSNDYDKAKETLLQRLAWGEKIFVLSTYKTIGAGQNLQYQIPEVVKEDVIKVNDLRKSDQKDFEFLYLECPTFVTEKLEPGISEETTVKSIFQTQMMLSNGELSKIQAKHLVEKAFHCLANEKYRLKLFVDQAFINTCPSVKGSVTKDVIQAIGRLTRTSNKTKEIYIYAEERIAEFLDYGQLKNRMLNKETEALVNCCRNTVRQAQDNYCQEINRSNLKTERSYQYINNLTRSVWTQDRMDTYNRMGEYVMRHPTVSKQLYDSNAFANQSYIPFAANKKEIEYKQTNDYRDVDIIDGHIAGYQVVSEEDCGLTRMMQIGFVKDYFIKNGYATSFEHEYVMNPVLYNNIYKGRLGEHFLVAYFQHVFNTDLETISDPAFFEKFDFKLSETDIFIDAKNWKSSMDLDDAEYTEKIVRKAIECKAEKVLIINVFNDDEKNVVRQKTVGKQDGYSVDILIVPCLVDADNNIIKTIAKDIINFLEG